MQHDRRNKTLFATSVFSAALTGALGEMEEYFDEGLYMQGHQRKESDTQDSTSHH